MTTAFSKILRQTALIIAIIFTSETVLQAAPLSASINTVPAAMPAAQIPIPPFLSMPPVELPQDLGKIEDIFPAAANSKTPFIYLIQDAHDSLDAQESIRQILKTLAEKEKVSLICFEGGSSELNHSFYNFAGNPKSNKQVWDALFAKGLIGGLERAALENYSGASFYGIEDEKVYFQNIHKIQKIFSGENKSREILGQIDRITSELAGRLLTGDVKKLRDLKRAFETKRLDLMQYAKALIRKSELNQNEWPQLSRLLKLQEFEIRVKKNQESTQKELDQIKKKSAKSSINFVWDSAQHARVSGRLRWYFERISDELLEQHVSLEKYTYLKDWIGFHVLQDEISSRELFNEIKRFEITLFNDLKLNDKQKYFLALEEDCIRIKNLIDLELTREDWQDIQSRKLDIKEVAIKVISFYEEIFGRKPKISVSGSLYLIQLFKTAKENYAIVEQRDQILSKRILERIESAKSAKVAVLAGGFHTDQLAAFLKEKNIGFAVISPAIRDINRKLNYRERMMLKNQGTSKISSNQETALPVAGSLGSLDAKPFEENIRLEATKFLAEINASSLGASQSAKNISLRANDLSRSGRDWDAIDVLEKGLALPENQRDGILWFQLAKSYWVLKISAKALEAIRKAKSINPNDDRVLMLMTQILLELNDSEASLKEARELIDAAIAQKPVIQNFTVKVQALRLAGDIPGAIELAEKIKSKWPYDRKIYGILSKLYLDSGRPDDAIRTVQEGLAINPGDHKGYSIESDLWRDRAEEAPEYVTKVQFLENALKAMDRAVALAPYHLGYKRLKAEIEKELSDVRASRPFSIYEKDPEASSLGAKQKAAKAADNKNLKYLRSITKFAFGNSAYEPGSSFETLVVRSGPQGLALFVGKMLHAATGFSEEKKQYEMLYERVREFLYQSDGNVLLNAVNVVAQKQLDVKNPQFKLDDVEEIMATLDFRFEADDLVHMAENNILHSLIIVKLKNGEMVQISYLIDLKHEAVKPADMTKIQELSDPRLTEDEGILERKNRRFISPVLTSSDGGLYRYAIVGDSVDLRLLAGYSSQMYRRAKEDSEIVRHAQAILFDELFWKNLGKKNSKALIFAAGEGRELIRLDSKKNVVDIPGALAARLIATDLMPGPLKKLKDRFPRITTVKSDWKKIPIPDKSVDAVFGLNAISFVPKRELSDVVRELDRILKPGSDGKKRMVFAVDWMPSHKRFLSDVQFDEKISEIDHDDFMFDWKKALNDEFAAKGYHVYFDLKKIETIVPEQESHRKLSSSKNRPLNVFSFTANRSVQAEFDRSLKPGEVKEIYSVLVVEVVKAASLGLKVVKTGEGLGDADESGEKPFKIIGFVASGGQGDVFLAEDVRNPGNIKTVILKRINATGNMPSELGDMQSVQHDSAVRRALESLKKEAERLERMNHPNVVKIYDFYDGKTDKFIVMEPVDGERLDLWLKSDGKSTSLRQVVEKLIPIADALDHAHERGVVHRDVKPQNVIVRSNSDGSSDFVLTDFGLSGEIEDAHQLLQSRSLMSVDRSTVSGGTPQFMSPEQARGNDRRAFHATTDVWSFGVMLYWLTTGSFPFPIDNPEDLKKAILHGNPLAPSLAASKNNRTEMPQDLEDLILKMLEKDPAKRPQSMKHVKEALEKIDWTKPARGDVRPVVIASVEPKKKSEDETEKWVEEMMPSFGQRRALMRFLIIGIIAAAALAIGFLAVPSFIAEHVGRIILAAVFVGGFGTLTYVVIKALSHGAVKLSELSKQIEKDGKEDEKEEKLIELIEKIEAGSEQLPPDDLKQLNSLLKEAEEILPGLAERIIKINDQVLSRHQKYDELVEFYEEWFSEDRPQSKREYVQRRLREAQILEENLKKMDEASLCLKDAEEHIKEDKSGEDFDDLIAKIKISEARLLVKEAQSQQINVEIHNLAVLAVDRATAALKTKVYRVKQFEPRRERLRANIQMLESGYTTGFNSDYLNEDLEYLFSAPGIPQPDGERFYLRGRARMLKSEPHFESAIIDFERAVHKSQSHYPLLYDIHIAEAEAYYELAMNKKDPDKNKEWAERTYQKVIDTAEAGEMNLPLKARVLESRARSRAKAGKNDEAVRDFMEAAKLRMASEEKPHQEPGINLLLRAVEQPDARIVDAASTALAKLTEKVINPELVVQRLIKELDGSTKSGAVIALSRIGVPAILPCLEILEKKPRTSEAASAAEVLGKMGDKAVFPLIEAVRRESENNPAFGYEIHALGKAVALSKGAVGLDPAVRILKQIVNSPARSPHKETAVIGLGQIAKALKDVKEHQELVTELVVEFLVLAKTDMPQALEALSNFPDVRNWEIILEKALLASDFRPFAREVLKKMIESADREALENFDEAIEIKRPEWPAFHTLARPYVEMAQKRKDQLEQEQGAKKEKQDTKISAPATESESRRNQVVKMAEHLLDEGEHDVQVVSGDPSPVELAEEIREALPVVASQKLSPVPAQMDKKAERAPPVKSRPALSTFAAEPEKPAPAGPKRFNLEVAAAIQKALQMNAKTSAEEIWKKLPSNVRNAISRENFEKFFQEELAALPAPAEIAEPEAADQSDDEESDQNDVPPALANSLGEETPVQKYLRSITDAEFKMEVDKRLAKRIMEIELKEASGRTAWSLQRRAFQQAVMDFVLDENGEVFARVLSRVLGQEIKAEDIPEHVSKINAVYVPPIEVSGSKLKGYRGEVDLLLHHERVRKKVIETGFYVSLKNGKTVHFSADWDIRPRGIRQGDSSSMNPKVLDGFVKQDRIIHVSIFGEVTKMFISGVFYREDGAISRYAYHPETGANKDDVRHIVNKMNLVLGPLPAEPQPPVEVKPEPVKKEAASVTVKPAKKEVPPPAFGRLFSAGKRQHLKDVVTQFSQYSPKKQNHLKELSGRTFREFRRARMVKQLVGENFYFRVYQRDNGDLFWSRDDNGDEFAVVWESNSVREATPEEIAGIAAKFENENKQYDFAEKNLGPELVRVYRKNPYDPYTSLRNLNKKMGEEGVDNPEDAKVFMEIYGNDLERIIAGKPNQDKIALEKLTIQELREIILNYGISHLDFLARIVYKITGISRKDLLQHFVKIGFDPKNEFAPEEQTDVSVSAVSRDPLFQYHIAVAAGKYVDKQKFLDNQFGPRVLSKIRGHLNNPFMAHVRVKNWVRVHIGNQRLYFKVFPDEHTVVIIAFQSAGEIKKNEGAGQLSDEFKNYLSKTSVFAGLSELTEAGYGFDTYKLSSDGKLEIMPVKINGKSKAGVSGNSLGITDDEDEGVFDNDGWKPLFIPDTGPDFERDINRLEMLNDTVLELMECGSWFNAYKFIASIKWIRFFWGMRIPAILIYQTGVVLKNLRLNEQAVAALTEAFQEFSGWDDSIIEKNDYMLHTLKQRGDLYMEMGRHADAVSDFSYVLALLDLTEPDRAAILECRGFAYLYLSEWNKASRDLENVFAEDLKANMETPIQVYLGLALALRRLGRGPEEREILRRASKEFPDSIAPEIYQSLKLLERRKYIQALRKLKDSRSKAKKNELIYLHLVQGYIFVARKQFDEALREFDAVIALDMTHDLAVRNVIRIRDWKKSPDNAKPSFQPLSVFSPVLFSYFSRNIEDEEEIPYPEDDDVIGQLKEIKDLQQRIFEIERILSASPASRPRSLALLRADTYYDANSQEKKDTGKNSPIFLLFALSAYREVRDIDSANGRKSTTGFVASRIAKIEAIMGEKGYVGIANSDLNQSEDMDAIVIQRIEAIENPDQKLAEIETAFQVHGPLPELILFKAIALLEKFEAIQKPNKTHIRLLTQSESAFREILKLDEDHVVANHGIARINEIKSRLFGGGDGAGEFAIAKSLGHSNHVEERKALIIYCMKNPSFIDDFLHSGHHLRVDPDKLRAVIEGRIIVFDDKRKTLEEIGNNYDNSKEAIQKIEVKLIEAMTGYLKFRKLKELAASKKKRLVLSHSVLDLNLGARAQNALLHISGDGEVMTIHQLIQMTPKELRAKVEKNFNQASLGEIVSQLRKLDLDLAQELTEQEKLDAVFNELLILAKKKQKAKILASAVSKLGLPDRAIVILQEVGKRKLKKKEGLTVGDILKFRRSDILTEFGAGERTADVIVDRLSHLNLELALEPEKPSRLPAIDQLIKMVAEGRKDEVLARPVVDLVLYGKTGKVVERLSRIRFGKERQMTVAEFLDILDNDPEIIEMVRQGMPSVMEDLRHGKLRELRYELKMAEKQVKSSASSLGNDGYEEDRDPRLIEMENDLELYMRGNQYKKALDKITQIEDYLDDRGFKMQPLHYFNRGSIYQNMGRFERSIQPFTQAIELYKSIPRDEEMDEELWDCYLSRGVAHMNLKQWDAAILDFNEAFKISKMDPEILELRGLVYFRKSEWIKAIKDLSEAVQAGGAPLRVYLALAYAYDMADMSHDRDRIEEKMAKKFPRSSKVNFAKALIRFEKKLAKAPLKYINEAVEKQGSNEKAAVYLIKGYISANLKNWEEAETAFRKARDLDPLNPEPRYQLAGVLYRNPKINWETANDELNEANFLAGTSLNETALIKLFQDKKRSRRKATEFGLAYLLEEEEIAKVHPMKIQSLNGAFIALTDLSAKQQRIELGMALLGHTPAMLLLHAEILIQRFEAAKKLTGNESRNFLEDALRDYQSILELEPDNAVAQDKFKKITEQIEAIKNKKAGDSSAASLGKKELMFDLDGKRLAVGPTKSGASFFDIDNPSNELKDLFGLGSSVEKYKFYISYQDAALIAEVKKMGLVMIPLRGDLDLQKAAHFYNVAYRPDHPLEGIKFGINKTYNLEEVYVPKNKGLALAYRIRISFNTTKTKRAAGKSLGQAGSPRELWDQGQLDALQLRINPKLVYPGLIFDEEFVPGLSSADHREWWTRRHLAGNSHTHEWVQDGIKAVNRHYFAGKDFTGNVFLGYKFHQIMHDVFLVTFTPTQQDEFRKLAEEIRIKLFARPTDRQEKFPLGLDADLSGDPVTNLINLSEMFAQLAAAYFRHKLNPEWMYELDNPDFVNPEDYVPYFDRLGLIAADASGFKDQYGNSLGSVRFVTKAAGGIIGDLLRIHFPSAYAALSSEIEPSNTEKQSFKDSVTVVVTKDYFVKNKDILVKNFKKNEIVVLIKPGTDSKFLDSVKESAIPVEKLELGKALKDRENIFSLEFFTQDTMTVPPAHEMFRFKWNESEFASRSDQQDALAKLRRFFLVKNSKTRKEMLHREGVMETAGFWFLNQRFLDVIEKLTRSAQAEKSLKAAA